MPFRPNRLRGQSATEYMLVVSVVVIGVVAASYVFVPRFRAGVERLGSDVNDMLSTGKIGTHTGRGRADAGPPAPSSPLEDFNRGCGGGLVCDPARAGFGSGGFGSRLGEPARVCAAGGDRC